jgi:predicted nucleic acid-binding protein
MPEVVFDTDVLVDHLQGKGRIGSDLEGSFYSSITRAELYSGDGTDERVIDRLLDYFDEIAVDRRIAEEAGRIRRIRGLRLPDALIAATAVVVKRPLYIRNVRDFRRVKRLSLHRPTGSRP